MTATPSDDEIVLLARQAGLDLPAEYLPELIEAYGHVRRMIDRLPAGRPRGDEPAHVFVARKFQPGKFQPAGE
ncbi:MAG: hypothetical protein ABSE20_17405 [Acetobacteraceae bacterium]|jgi:hypothetical protein